jgi:hypothetical protein
VAVVSGWDIGGDYDAWKTTEPEPAKAADEDEPQDFDERRDEDG